MLILVPIIFSIAALQGTPTSQSSGLGKGIMGVTKGSRTPTDQETDSADSRERYRPVWGRGEVRRHVRDAYS